MTVSKSMHEVCLYVGGGGQTETERPKSAANDPTDR